LQLSEKIHEPAQAANVLTVGAFTERVELPPGQTYSEYRIVATQPGGVSPFTSTGVAGSEWPIKPDVVMEGGNLAVSQLLYDSGIDTLSGLTTQRTQIAGRPLTMLNMTSEATAHAARLAATIWLTEPKLRPESVRGLIVHSASWTTVMREQFPSINDRLIACGYGVPDERLASECAHGVATIVVEDKLPNAVLEEEPKKKAPKRLDTKVTEPKLRRKAKVYRLPIPESLLLDLDPDVELRVTLSYFAEPNKFGRSIYRGLDLKWDMQGPQELEDEFLQRINVLRRPKGPDGKPVKVASKKSFPWDVGIQWRSRGTVQSDRWRGKMSALVGDKLIAIVPVLGWWDQRKTLKTQEMPFSLVVSVFGPRVYAAIKPRIEAEAALPIEI
jgi:Subtilase family